MRSLLISGTTALFLCVAVALVSPPAGAAGDPAGWFPQASGTTRHLYTVDFTSTSHGAAAGANGTALRTADGGATWTAVASGVSDPLNAISLGDANQGIAAGGGGTILRTTNGGSSWSVIRNGWTDSFFGAHMLTPVVGFVAGVNGIFQPLVGRTSDGGGTWAFASFYFNGNEGTLRDVHFLNPTTGFAVGNLWDGRGAIARSVNGGATWSTLLVTAGPLIALDFPTATVGVAVGTTGAILRTTNGGASWTPQSSGTSADLYGIACPSSAVHYAVGDFGTILKTDDGATWSSQDAGSAAHLRAVAFTDALTGTIVGQDGLVLRTVTGGSEATSVAGESAAGGFTASGEAGEGLLVLDPAFPNPAAGALQLRFRLSADASVNLAVFDMAGRKVREMDLGARAAGTQEATWDGVDKEGRRVAPGVYAMRVQAAGADSAPPVTASARVIVGVR